MRKWTVRLVVLLVICAGLWVLRVTVFVPDPVQVNTVEVERGAVESTITNSKAGTVRARRRAKLSPGTGGNVVEILVERGQRVKAGQLLLRLDDSTLAAQLELAARALTVAEASHERSCISAERAARELDRNRGLGAGIVSDDMLDRLDSLERMARAECAVSQAEVERARAAVGVARTELEKTRLIAPFDAIVAEKSVELGEWVTPSVPLLAAPELIDAIDPSSLYISAPMDEVDAARLSVGLVVRVSIDPYPDRVFPGRVARVAPFVLDLERQNRTIEVEVELDDASFASSLLPGTSADVEVILETRQNVLRIPTRALLSGGRVLVVEREKLVEREVGIGIKNWDWVEILRGLEEGEPVVTTLDRLEVQAGARVRARSVGAAGKVEAAP
jgi:HlyD family secretion protein